MQINITLVQSYLRATTNDTITAVREVAEHYGISVSEACFVCAKAEELNKQEK